jgi:hypothetical protein
VADYCESLEGTIWRGIVRVITADHKGAIALQLVLLDVVVFANRGNKRGNKLSTLVENTIFHKGYEASFERFHTNDHAKAFRKKFLKAFLLWTGQLCVVDHAWGTMPYEEPFR